MISPESAQAALDAIGEARSSGRPIWIRGSGTHRFVDGESTILSTAALDTIVEYRPDDLTIRVEPGLTLEAMHREIGSHRQTAVLPESEGHRTVGGVVASAASGYRRLKYGPTRDRVLGVTIATGYGELVKGGGQLVTNVTGYDLPRLATGSFGSLGIITEIILKLWPTPPSSATIEIEDAATAYREAFKPLAVHETEAGAFAYLEGSEAAVREQVGRLGGPAEDGLRWPEPINEPVVVSVRVPPSAMGAAAALVKATGPSRWVAQHGVGRFDVGLTSLSAEQLASLRTDIAAARGVVTVERHPMLDGLDRWGVVPQGIEIQRRLKRLFDPDRVCNPGVLPGGL